VEWYLTYRDIRPVNWVVIAIIVIVALVIGFHGAIDRQLHNWKVLPEPERLTELYFTHPNTLPTTYTTGQTLPVDFTVHNLEYKTETYRYQISEANNAGSQTKILDTGSFVLKQSKYHMASVNITTTDMGSRANVKVTLVKINESVDYWVNKFSTTGGGA
jgi:uncharacterized membrane protein